MSNLGYRRFQLNCQRYFRASSNVGTVDDDSIADAIWEGERWMHDLIVESGTAWAVKRTVIDDSALGTQIELGVHELFINSVLGITDLAKVQQLWRVDPNNLMVSGRISYLYSESTQEHVRSPGSLIGPSGEFYTESGGVNASGRQEASILIYNKGTAMEGGSLRVDYWWVPQVVQTAWFTETDASGNVGRIPDLPEVLWSPILNYAKWVLTEQTGDTDRRNALARRFHGEAGLTKRVRQWLSNFQTEESVHVRDHWSEEA
jgi:hypothetical protein